MSLERADRALRWARGAWPARDWTGAVAMHGAFHDVVVAAGRHAARIAAGRGARERVRREVATAMSFARLGLPWAVPDVLDGPVERDGAVGMLTTFVPGTLRPTADWRDVRDGWASILASLRNAAADDGALGPPRAWCGGAGWPELVRERLAPRLPADVRGAAVTLVEDLLAVERDAPAAVVHGDVGPHNVTWAAGDDGELTPIGLLDLDHAAHGDPAIDVAPLIGAYGAAAVTDLVTQDVLERAMRHRATLSLQVAGAAELIGDVGVRNHALANVVERWHAGTLYDPGGTAPRGGPPSAQARRHRQNG